MRNLLAVALLAAIAPLGIAQAATPKTTPAAVATAKPTTMVMKGHKMPMKAHKTSTKTKKAASKKMTKTSAKKTMPARDPKTGRFMKTTAPTTKTTKK